MSSLRSYLLVAVLSAITLTSFIAALYGYRAGVDAADALFDAQLTDSAMLLSGLLAAGHDTGQVLVAGDTAFQAWDDQGRLRLRSADTPATPIAPFEAGFRFTNFAEHRWRVLVRREPAAGLWVMVAERADARFLLADSVARESLLAVLAVLPVTALLIWLIVGHGLRRLDRLAAALAGKAADDLKPLDATDAPAELAVIIRAVNGLLQRLEVSLDRERRLTADAAHELRTPIAALKVDLHNLAGRLPADDPLLRRLNADTARLEHLIAQILLLYRMSPEQYRAHLEPLDLTALAGEAIADSYAQFEARGQDIQLHGTRQPLQGDRFALTTLLQNLLANASRYTPPGGRIRVSTAPADGGVQLEVSDSGPGLPPAERERVFDRFYRHVGTRHLDPAGSGLGLSIVRLVADLHGARVVFDHSPFGSGLTVRVLFPAPRPT
ncbi:ATP-binding protein [Immundisolibacter sp.]|uniref:sensor histidine kinase n=1 Tax=Immundisolibacter sp. TaxID=1934948 RepID=UPI002607F9F7|nr:ATP-binding protein [Immundisolibacter sp.]MDD3650882.1 ATP-binding protein [Immundisolibacter sp.]